MKTSNYIYKYYNKNYCKLCNNKVLEDILVDLYIIYTCDVCDLYYYLTDAEIDDFIEFNIKMFDKDILFCQQYTNHLRIVYKNIEKEIIYNLDSNRVLTKNEVNFYIEKAIKQINIL